MIPLYKLEKLPRSQKLRKIAKIFSMAENRLRFAVQKSSGVFTDSELVFFADSAKLLAQDAKFQAQAHEVFRESAGVFSSAIHCENTATLERALNNVKHLLLSATGREPADWDFTDKDGKLDLSRRQIFEGMQVYFEDIRSPFNVGAMFRTAESFGVEKIILSPFCADPHHRRAERTAMGCIDIVPWERQNLFASEETNLFPFPVFALETGGTPIGEFPFPRNGLLITGSEELGVSPRALA
ncbi:MAG: TrmH family RNA methyltransferase, partial [Treponema sp.]|nr:TrmH family RNA methyltransferase [Treponema sp.]